MFAADEDRLLKLKRATPSRLFAILIAGVVFAVWLLSTPSGLLGKADAVGYALCHRIDLRSFQLGTRQLPLCARCSGMYLGALITLLFYLTQRPRAGYYPNRWLNLTLLTFAVIWAVDGTNSYIQLVPGVTGVYPPSNPLRLITGTLLESPWRPWSTRPSTNLPGRISSLNRSCDLSAIW